MGRSGLRLGPAGFWVSWQELSAKKGRLDHKYCQDLGSQASYNEFVGDMLYMEASFAHHKAELHCWQQERSRAHSTLEPVKWAQEPSLNR